MDQDPRRQHPIKLRWQGAETAHLCIDGELWSEVEWSDKRKAWCVQDAEGAMPEPQESHSRSGCGQGGRCCAG
jgi:hypothetical protein